MKKALWISASVAVVTVALVSASTYALFKASAPAQDSTLTAGKLCLVANRNDGDPIPGPMFYITAGSGAAQTPIGPIAGTHPTGLWAPGDSQTRTLTVTNDISCSTMSAWLDSVTAELAPGSYADMASKLLVQVLTPNGGSDVLVAQAPLTSFLNGPVLLHYPDGTHVPVVLTSNQHVKFKVTFDQSAGNEFQGKTLVAHFTLHGVQQRNNSNP